MIIAGLLLTGPIVVQAQYTPQDLLPQARFERPAALDAWRAQGEKWMLSKFKVTAEDGQTFLRVTEPPATITTVAPVPASAQELAFTGKVRTQGIEPGKNAWDAPLIGFTFFDRFGNEIADGWKGGWRFPQDTNGWQSFGRRYPVPAGARSARVELSFKPKKGTFDIADLKLFDVARAPQGVNATVLEKLDISQPLDAKAKREGFPILDPKRGFGVQVDEKGIAITLHVSPQAAAGGDGAQAKPFNSLPQAVEAARAQLNAGKGVRIALQPGLYRLTQEKKMLEGRANAALDLTNWTEQGREAPLVIEGVGGPAILAGAEEWKADKWQVVDAAKGIYRAPWNENWGFHHAGYYTWKDIRLHRRELVALNGKPLDMAILESTSYTDPQGRVYDDIGNVIRQDKDIKKAAYTYTGWKNPVETLQPGQFGVAERDDHEGGDSLYIRLPENVKSLDGATIEVGKVRTLMMVNGKNNFVMRHLTFQHTASHYADYFGKAAFESGDWLSPKDTHDWKIENCTFRHNNGLGLRFFNVAYVDVSNVRAHDNGGPGVDTSHIRWGRYQNLEVLNNKRARPSGYHGHGGGGMSFSGEDCVFNDCKFNDNFGFGFREDVFGQRIVHERNQFNNNTEGIFYEISWGPITFKECQISNNQNRGIFLLNAHNVTVHGCELKDNGVALSFYNSPPRETPLELTSAYQGHSGIPIQMIHNLVVKDSVITGSKPEHRLVERTPKVGTLDHYLLLLKEEYTGENNRFFNPASTQVFEYGQQWAKQDWVDFATWQKVSGEKASSQWVPK